MFTKKGPYVRKLGKPLILYPVHTFDRAAGYKKVVIECIKMHQ